jgi:hypothetical protein
MNHDDYYYDNSDVHVFNTYKRPTIYSVIGMTRCNTVFLNLTCPRTLFGYEK